MLSKVSKKLGFTSYELSTLLFLLLLFLTGLVIKVSRTEAPEAEQFGYAAADSLFTNLAERADSENYSAFNSANVDSKQDFSDFKSQEFLRKTGADELAGNSIDINTAAYKELLLLPGIGPRTAEKIIAYRKENGGFQSIEEITNVSGIGRRKFQEIKHYIYTK